MVCIFILIDKYIYPYVKNDSKKYYVSNFIQILSDIRTHSTKIAAATKT